MDNIEFEVFEADDRIFDSIRQKDISSLKSLISLGSDINKLGYHKEVPMDISRNFTFDLAEITAISPLCYAIYCHNLDAVELLLKSGAKSMHHPNDAIEASVKVGSIEMLNIILSNLDLISASEYQLRNNLLFTAMRTATLEGRPDMLIQLITSGGNVGIADESGYTLLMLATMSNHLEVVKTLIDIGANPNDIDIDGSTALFFSMQFEDREVFNYLYPLTSPEKREKAILDSYHFSD